MKRFRYIGWIGFLLGITCAQAQEEKYLDATPQDVYNPTTTLFITQEDLQYNLGSYKAVAEDMCISNIHRFTFVQQYGNRLQNLGNNGTAVQPIFYVMPEDIGRTSGFHAYDIYFRSPRQFRYYDTKSPYSKLYVMLARFGSFYTDICHSHNVTPYWNVGANFRNMMTDKEWISLKSGDRNVIAYAFDLFTNYKTECERYQLLAHFLIAKHRVRDTGGVYTYSYVNNKDHDESALWKRDTQSRFMTTDVRDFKKRLGSSDGRRRFHMYHQLALSETLWVYHALRTQKQQHKFKVDALNKKGQEFLGDTSSTEAAKKIRTLSTLYTFKKELGVKGIWTNWFYSSYYRYQRLAWRNQHEKDDYESLEHENYIGLYTRYHVADDTKFLHLAGEYLFQDCYKARAAYETNHFDLSFEHIRHKPSFLVQRYRGYQRAWGPSEWAPPTVTQFCGACKLASKYVQLKPALRFLWVYDAIYFTHKNPTQQRRTAIAVPQQSSNNLYTFIWDTEMELVLWRNVHWDSTLTLAKAFGEDVKLFPMPNCLINTKLYYTNTTPTGNGTFETGIDVHWKSSYKANAYDPVTQQFYFQDDFNIHNYPVIDLFLDFRIKHFSAFLKFSHCNEYWLAPAPGYFVTPFYPGQKKAFDIGFIWSFFD